MTTMVDLLVCHELFNPLSVLTMLLKPRIEHGIAPARAVDAGSELYYIRSLKLKVSDCLVFILFTTCAPHQIAQASSLIHVCVYLQCSGVSQVAQISHRGVIREGRGTGGYTSVRGRRIG